MSARRLSVLWSIVMVGIGLVAPRSALGQIVVTGPTIMERSVAAGETYRGAIPIRNSSGAPEVARLYLADYLSDPLRLLAEC